MPPKVAKGFTEAVLDEIKSRIDLVELISSYGVEVKTAGTSKKACCPFHREKTPSFHINESTGLYHCFGCGESGDAIRFVEKMEGLSFTDAVRKLFPTPKPPCRKRPPPPSGLNRRAYSAHWSNTNSAMLLGSA